MPVEWVRVHDLADFAYFNHSAHVTRGVSCVHCHGRIDRMEEVYQAKRLSMDFCLDCHRNPAPFLRPIDKVTDLDWEPDDSWGRGRPSLGASDGLADGGSLARRDGVCRNRLDLERDLFTVLTFVFVLSRSFRFDQALMKVLVKFEGVL